MSKRMATRYGSSGSTAMSKRTRKESPLKCTIDDLPDELLARVFQKLPYWELFTAEEVSHRWRRLAKRHGWTSVEGIAVPGYLLPSVFRRNRSVLGRCGSYLQWLTLGSASEKHLALLRQCPNVRNLQFGHDKDVLPMVEVLRELYANKLKSLSLHVSMNHGSDGAVQVAALNSLFDAATESLEFLRFTGYNSNKVRFPDQLRYLELKEKNSASAFFSQLSDGRLFAHLRSLELGFNYHNEMPLISSLEHLPQLAHLALHDGWHVDTATIEKLSSALSRLANFKSLEVEGGPLLLLEAISRECPQLEHLGWKGSHATLTKSFKALQAVGESLTQLRSLEITEFSYGWSKYTCIRPPFWEWFEAIAERGLLEYLSIDVEMPPRFLYKLIQRCPKLKVISVVDSGWYSTHDRPKKLQRKYSAEKMAAAAAEAVADGRGSLSVIYSHMFAVKFEEEEDAEVPEKRIGRIEFRKPRFENQLESHVLRHYSYGCLSEGKPKWEEIK